LEKIDLDKNLGGGPQRVLVTGAAGFVGSALCARLGQSGIQHRRALRRDAEATSNDAVLNGDIGSDTDWQGALRGISSVIHLAARAHDMRETASYPLSIYRETNVAGTRRLAEAAAGEGVRHFIYVSSIKVNGERTEAQPFRETDAPRPEDAYGVTKLEAEQELNRIAAGTNMAITIIRPPLVYGPGVKGNFLKMMLAVSKGVPLPLASIKNSRSLIYVENLVSAIVACLGNPLGAGHTFLVSDEHDLSTPELIRHIAAALAVRPRLYRFPPSLLRVVGSLVGRREQIVRLTDSLQVDSSLIRRVLGWTPPFSVEQGLAETARWFEANSASR
jgi:nucleoside-diphosphate-sugar epimerase